MTPEQQRSLEGLMEAIGHRFATPELLLEAVTHASFRNECPVTGVDNERLEFLGDAVLGAVVSHLLAVSYPDAREGTLTRFKSVLVSERGLARTARELDLGRYLRLGRGEEGTGGRTKDSVLANAVEAIYAAVYLDSGYERVFQLIERLYGDRIREVGRAERRVDFKTKLQELIQSTEHVVPCYAIVAATGPDHEREYEAVVLVDGTEIGRGSGRSKKLAEQAAARSAFERRVQSTEP